MGKAFLGRVLSALAVLLALGFLAGPAVAGVPAPPVRSTVDANGVDLTSGVPLLIRKDVSIGPDDHHGLSWTQQWVGNGWRYSDLPTISGSTSAPTVSWRGKSVAFTLVSGAYKPYFEDGSTLSTDHLTFTASDGTVIVFSSLTDSFAMDSNLGTPVTITFPDGVVRTFSYQTGNYTYTPTLPPECYQDPLPYDLQLTCWSMNQPQYFYYRRLQAILSSTGYELHLNYLGDVLDSTSSYAWQTLTGVEAINNTVEFCNPTASTCSLTNTWPEATYGPTTYTDPEGVQTTYSYDTNGLLTGIKLPDTSANIITYAYTGGKVSSVQKAGQTWGYSYTSTTTTVTDPASNTRVVTYNTDKGVTADQNEVGKITSFAWCTTSDTNCPVGLLKSTTAPEGNKANYAYDTRGNLKSTTYVAKSGSGLSNITTSATYPSSCINPKTCNKPATTTDGKGNVTDYAYDSNSGGVTSIKSPADSGGTRPETRITYTAKQAKYLNSTTTYTNSGNIYVPTAISTCRTGTSPSCVGTANENVKTVTYPGSTAVNNLLPTQVNTKAGDNTLSATTAFTYNNLGELLTVDGPLSGTADTARIRYTTAGQVVGTIGPDPDGTGTAKLPAVKYTYDTSGRRYLVQSGTVNSLSDADWASFSEVSRSTIQYESTYGRTWRQRVGSSSTNYQVTDAVYDTLGRVSCSIQRMDPANWGSTPPTSCNPPQTTGTYGPDRVVKNTYDAASRVTKVTSSYGISGAAADDVTQTYSNNGLLATATDAEGNKTTYEYDGFDRLSKTRYPDTTKGAGTSSTTDYEQATYDANGNVATYRTRRAETISLAYDNLNRPTLKDIPARSGLASTYTRDVYFGYDLFGGMTYARFDSASGEGITNTYNARGELTGTSNDMDSTSRALSYLYDVAGNLTRITHPDGNYAGYNYSASGSLSTIDLNGTSPLIGLDLDSAGRLSALKRYNTSSSSWAQSTGVTYDAISRLATLSLDPASTSQDASTTFTYNPDSQIRTAVRDNDAYAWDGAANVNRNYTSNGLNEYSAVASTSFTYDTNGNLTSDGTDTYVYDIENRLVTRSGGGSASLRYDPLGRLYEVASGSDTTRFLYDRDNLVGEYNGSGTLLRRYVHGLSGGDDPWVWFEGNGVANSARRYLYSDERGSVIAITDSTGATINSGMNSYDEHGIPGSANLGRFQYTGQVWLPEIGMYYFKARMFSPTLGRFLQADPIRYADGMNIYAYVGNDPLNKLDPSGLVAGLGCSSTPNRIEVCAGHSFIIPPGPIPEWTCLVLGLSDCSPHAIDPRPVTNPVGGGPAVGAPRRDPIKPKPVGKDGCTFGRKLAGDVAKGFSDLSTIFWSFDAAAGLATLVSGVGEFVTLGADTPATVASGSATVTLAGLALGTGALSAAFQTYANSGNPSSLASLNLSEFSGKASGSIIGSIPGLGKYAGMMESLVGQATSVATGVETKCSNALSM